MIWLVGPKSLNVTVRPVSSVTVRMPPDSVTGSEKLTVTLIRAPTR